MAKKLVFKKKSGNRRNGTAKQLSATEKRLLRLQVRQLVVDGFDDEAIAGNLGISIQQAIGIHKALDESELEHLRTQNNDNVYLTYLRAMEKCLLDLDSIILSNKGRSATASVSAVKAKVDIYNGVIRTGRDLGFIRSTPKRLEIAGGLDFTTMPADEMRRQIVMEMMAMREMLERHGDVDILDVDFEEIKTQEEAAIAAGDAPPSVDMMKLNPVLRGEYKKRQKLRDKYRPHANSRA